jgi:hypothetical protein
MTCNRCQPNRLCLNHEAEAKSAAFLRARDEREAISRGRARWAQNGTFEFTAMNRRIL